jgi:CubicO group peptidase (beta-lactamase class C family)
MSGLWHMSLRRLVALGLLALAALVPGLYAADQFDSIRATIRKAVVEQGTPSIAVSVVKNGEIVWEEGFGWADREKRIPSSAHTMYSLASVSKSFTATGLMILKEQGKIDLDQPINNYLGDAKVTARIGNAADATVRRVLNHSSGLPLHYQFFYEDEPTRRPPMETTILRYANLITPPGENYEYSNLGYGLIDYVISRVSGKPYIDFMREQVFQPLGLTHTSVNVGPGLAAYAAQRYATDGTPIPFYDFDHPGGSAVYASAHDMANYGMFQLKEHLAEQKRILSDASIDEMHRPSMKTGPHSGYGMGWEDMELANGMHVVQHTGGMGGVSTIIRLIPAKRVAIVVLVNGRSLPLGQLTSQIMMAVVPEAGAPYPMPPQPSAVSLAEYAGTWKGSVHTYMGDQPVTLTIKDGEGRLKIGQQLESLVNGLHVEDGYLVGQAASEIDTDDAKRYPEFVQLSLKLRGDSLNGGITAMSKPAVRVGNALTCWADLKRQ